MLLEPLNPLSGPRGPHSLHSLHALPSLVAKSDPRTSHAHSPSRKRGHVVGTPKHPLGSERPPTSSMACTHKPPMGESGPCASHAHYSSRKRRACCGSPQTPSLAREAPHSLHGLYTQASHSQIWPLRKPRSQPKLEEGSMLLEPSKPLSGLRGSMACTHYPLVAKSHPCASHAHCTSQKRGACCGSLQTSSWAQEALHSLHGLHTKSSHGRILPS